MYFFAFLLRRRWRKLCRGKHHWTGQTPRQNASPTFRGSQRWSEKSSGWSGRPCRGRNTARPGSSWWQHAHTEYTRFHLKGKSHSNETLPTKMFASQPFDSVLSNFTGSTANYKASPDTAPRNAHRTVWFTLMKMVEIFLLVATFGHLDQFEYDAVAVTDFSQSQLVIRAIIWTG